jgi:hypothetical protein
MAEAAVVTPGDVGELFPLDDSTPWGTAMRNM